MGGKVLSVALGGGIAFMVIQQFVSTLCGNTTGWSTLSVLAFCQLVPMAVAIGVLYMILRAVGLVSGGFGD